MSTTHNTQAKYTLSRILNNDFLRWLDDYFKKGERHAQVQTL
jgi:hypothetical protein